MFERLVRSRPGTVGSLSQTALSLALHAAAGYAAIHAAVESGASPIAARDVGAMVLLDPPEPPPPPSAPIPPPSGAMVPASRPPLGFQTVPPPVAIPTDIPPVTLAERFNAADFSGRGVEGGVAGGIPGSTRPAPVQQEVYLEAQVEVPVRVMHIPTPHYPDVLREAGVAGRLVVEFIVDTAGRAEAGSWRVMRMTNPAFVEPAREAILQGVFRPARIGGRAVRQLVRQVISYAIKP